MTFFAAVSRALTEQSKSVFIEVSGAGEGRIRVVITPDIGQVPADATPEAAQVYSLMARPLLVSGTPDEVESSLVARLGQLTALLDEGESTLQALREIKAKASVAAPTAPNLPATPVGDSVVDEPAAQTAEAPNTTGSIGSNF